MKSVIKVENLGKKYIIGHQKQKGYVALRDVIASKVKSIGKSKIEKGTSEEFWALKNLSFEIEQGDRIGIIGRNGAGKSTLLKILSRITAPSTGSVGIKGKVASLLEVGTGFHPELTGRENIFLNGAILGMSKVEIKKKFDQIVEFAEVEKFLDTPVKRYSSGMYVKLAFAVASHLETEILVVDEVLAVGDVQFQKKSLGRMDSIGKDGRTVLFVSHNMGAISKLCTKGIVLNKGEIVYSGNIEKAIQVYTDDPSVREQSEWTGEAGDEEVKLFHTWVKCMDEDNGFHNAADLEVGIEIEVLKPLHGLILGFTLLSEFGYDLAYVLYDDNKTTMSEVVNPGRMIKRFIIPANTLAQGTYKIEFDVGIHMLKRFIRSEGSLSFTLENINGIGRRFITPNLRGRAGIFRPKWSLE